MEETPKTPYQDPELIAASNGDRQLLDRLVGMAIAKNNLETATSEDAKQRLQSIFDVMYSEVQRRREEIGLQPEDTPGTPE